MRQSLIVLLSLLLLLACTDGGEMRRELLALQDRNAADSLLHDDTLALRLTDYFDRHGTPNEQMLAHYLLARTYTDMGRAPEALEQYQYAIESADTLDEDCDLRRLSIVYCNMAALYLNCDMPESALQNYDKAAAFSLAIGDSSLFANYTFQKGHCYSLIQDFDSAIHVFMRGHELYKAIGDTLAANSCLSPVAYLLTEAKRFDEAREALDKFENHSEHTYGYINTQYGNISIEHINGYLNLYENNTSDAIRHFYNLLRLAYDSSLKCSAYKGLYLAYKQDNRLDSAFKYSNLYTTVNDSLTLARNSAQLAKMQSIYNYSHFRRYAEFHQNEARIASLRLRLYAVSTAILACLAFIFVYRYKVNKELDMDQVNQKYLLNLMLYKDTEKELKGLQKEKSNLENDINEKLKFLKDAIENDESANEDLSLSAIAEKALYKSSIVKLFKMHAHDYKQPDTIEWQKLLNALKIYLPGFIDKLSATEHKLNEREIRICILIRLDFSLQDIRILLDVSSQLLYNCRKRITEKLSGGKADVSNLDKILKKLE